MNSTEKMLAAALLGAALGVTGCGSSGGGMSPPSGNAAPSISPIGNQATNQDTPLMLAFGIADRESPPGSLMVSAVAGDGTVFPSDGLVLSGDSGSRTLTLTPLEAAAGTAQITLTVADPQGATVTRSFQVAVNVRNASMRGMALETFAKAEADEPTTLNGWTVQQDADDPAVFAGLIPAGEE